MVLSRDAFIDALTGLGELMPMGKTLSPSAIALAWGLFPITAKELLDSEHLLFAMQQLQLDPQPARDLSITVQLLRYLFPSTPPTFSATGVCTSEGQPILDRGLRPDLAQRMERPDVFHPLHQQAAARPAAQVLEEHRLLAPASDGAMEVLALVTKPLLLAARAAKEPADAPNTLTPKEQELGCLLAAGILIGRWTLEHLDRPTSSWVRDRPWRNLAREWIAAHPNGYAAMQAAADSARESPSRSTDAETPAAAPPAAFPGLVDRSDGVFAFDSLSAS